MSNISGKRNVDFLTHLRRVLPLFILFVSGIFCSSLIAENSGIATEQKPLPEDAIVNSVNLKAVKVDGGWGYTDLKGNTVISPFFQQARDFTEGLGQIKISGEWGYVDSTGKIAILPIYKETRAFSEGLAPVCVEGKWGFIDSKGDKRIDFKYADAHRFHEGVAAVSETGQGKFYGYITQDGTYKIKPGKFDDAMSFIEGLAAVKSNDKWGYLNHDGIIVIPCTFEKAEHFSKGLAAVMVNQKWGYISPEGKFAINPIYDFAGNFTDKGAFVSKERKSFIIDRTGKDTTPPSEFEYGDKFVLINDAMCGHNGNDYPACITIINFTNFEVWASGSTDENLDMDKIRGHVIHPWSNAEASLFSRNPTGRSGEIMLIARKGPEDKDWKGLCSMRFFPDKGNCMRPFGSCAVSLINQFIEKKGIPAGDKRTFCENTLYYPNQYLVFNLEEGYVWILVGDSWFGGGIGGYVPRQIVFRQPILFLIDKKLVPDWEYMFGMK